MDLIKLAIIFIVIIVLINFKIRLNIAVAVGAVLGAILYQMGFVHSFEVAWRGVWNADTISVIVITYLITFLQRMMEQKGDLLLAQRSLSRHLQQPPGQRLCGPYLHRPAAFSCRRLHRRRYGEKLLRRLSGQK